MAATETTHTINIVNRDDYPLFVPTPVEHFKVKRRITGVEVQKISFDEMYENLKAEGRQVDIRSPELFVDGRKPMDGIFSPLFGADSTKDTPVYTCDCGELTGGSNKGRLCKKCNSTCRTIEADLRNVMFIDIAPYHILTDLGMAAMRRALPKTLKEVLTSTRRIGRSGAVVKSDLPTIMDLYDDYDILYRAKAKEEKKYAFCSKIPVYTSRLRPLIQDRSRLSILDVNKNYLSIVSCAQIIRDETIIPGPKSEIKIQKTLNEIQRNFNEIMGIVDSQINKKKGVVRHALASGSLDYSFRLVITLGPDLMANEIDVPYHTMMVGCEEEIVRRLVDMDDIPVGKAIAKVEKHILHPHPKFVKIINMILRSGVGIWTLVNRNPTISKYGIGYFRIRKIHDDPDDFTLHLPVDVLHGFGADFSKDLYYTKRSVGIVA